MEPARAPSSPPIAPVPPAPRRRGARARFRERLERDPRRWVLFLAAAGGLVTAASRAQDSEVLTGDNPFAPLGLAAVLAFAPAGALALLWVRGQVLHWSGRLLRGAAPPHELRAAVAWSELPAIAVGWPLVLDLAARVATAGVPPPSPPLAFARDVLRAAAPLVDLAVVLAMALGAALEVAYVAEAQRFSAWRAIASELLAAVLGVAILGGGGAIGMLVAPPGHDFLGAFAGAAVTFPVLLAVVEAGAWVRRRR